MFGIMLSLPTTNEKKDITLKYKLNSLDLVTQFHGHKKKIKNSNITLILENYTRMKPYDCIVLHEDEIVFARVGFHHGQGLLSVRCQIAFDALFLQQEAQHAPVGQNVYNGG